MLNRTLAVVENTLRVTLALIIFGYLPIIMLLGIGWVFAKGFNLFVSLFL